LSNLTKVPAKKQKAGILPAILYEHL
jgi:hypothetical protein